MKRTYSFLYICSLPEILQIMGSSPVSVDCLAGSISKLRYWKLHMAFEEKVHTAALWQRYLPIMGKTIFVPLLPE